MSIPDAPVSPRALMSLRAALHRKLAQQGHATIPGLGKWTATGGALTFEGAPDLAALQPSIRGLLAGAMQLGAVRIPDLGVLHWDAEAASLSFEHEVPPPRRALSVDCKQLGGESLSDAVTQRLARHEREGVPLVKLMVTGADEDALVRLRPAIERVFRLRLDSASATHLPSLLGFDLSRLRSITIDPEGSERLESPLAPGRTLSGGGHLIDEDEVPSLDWAALDPAIDQVLQVAMSALSTLLEARHPAFAAELAVAVRPDHAVRMSRRWPSHAHGADELTSWEQARDLLCTPLSGQHSALDQELASIGYCAVDLAVRGGLDGEVGDDPGWIGQVIWATAVLQAAAKSPPSSVPELAAVTADGGDCEPLVDLIAAAFA